MTSLKRQDADEIIDAMARALGGDMFKAASVEKEAQGMSIELLMALMHEEYRKGKAQYDSMDEAQASKAVSTKVWNENLEDIQAQENKEPGFLERAADLRDSYMVPKRAADDGAAEQPCDDCDEQMAQDQPEREAQTSLAIDFAMGHLVKIADALDNKGFAGVASIVDETIEKLAKKKVKKKYKTWEGKDEKSPKGAEYKAPKEWFDKMKADVKKKNPDYSAKRIREIVGDIWDNELSEKKRKSILKKYEKGGKEKKAEDERPAKLAKSKDQD